MSLSRVFLTELRETRNDVPGHRRGSVIPTSCLNEVIPQDSIPQKVTLCPIIPWNILILPQWKTYPGLWDRFDL